MWVLGKAGHVESGSCTCEDCFCEAPTIYIIIVLNIITYSAKYTEYTSRPAVGTGSACLIAIREGWFGLIRSADVSGASYVGCQALVLDRAVAASARVEFIALLQRLPDRPIYDDRAGQRSQNIRRAGQGAPSEGDVWSLMDISRPGKGSESERDRSFFIGPGDQEPPH